jgi:uncharacterized membrane protein
MFGLFCVGLTFVPSGFEERLPKNSHLARARVLTVDNSRLRQVAIIKVGDQSATVEILDGPFRGRKTTVANLLSGKMDIDDILVEGRDILLEYSVQEDGRLGAAVSRGYYRLHMEWLLVLLFVAMLVLVAGWTGLKAMLSFLFSILLIWKVLIPLFLKGHDPILVALCVVAVLTGAVSFLVGGLGRKGLVTFLGTFSGLLLASILAHFSTRALRLPGAVLPFSENLLYSGFYFLNLSRIFVASICIACSGAVMDLAMDIAASMDEIRKKKPDVGFWEHIGSGMIVGRAVVGTMTTTLLLAYSGAYMGLLMFFVGQGVPLLSVLNRSFMAAEVLNTLVGSLAVVAVAPLTALVGGLLYRCPTHRCAVEAEPAIDVEPDATTLYTAVAHA